MNGQLHAIASSFPETQPPLALKKLTAGWASELIWLFRNGFEVCVIWMTCYCGFEAGIPKMTSLIVLLWETYRLFAYVLMIAFNNTMWDWEFAHDVAMDVTLCCRKVSPGILEVLASWRVKGASSPRILVGFLKLSEPHIQCQCHFPEDWILIT